MRQNKKCMICYNNLVDCLDGKKCPRCNYILHHSLFRETDTNKQIRKKENVIFQLATSSKKTKSSKDEYTYYYYDRTSKEQNPYPEDVGYKINIEPYVKKYPATFIKRMDAILNNISSLHESIGSYFAITNKDERMMLCETDDPESEIAYVISMMSELGYIVAEEDTLDESIYRCQITLTGWKRIEEINSSETKKDQAFIAMSFSADEKIQRRAEAFKKAIINAGYIPYKMDEIEHNNQIVPEMFYEISRSKFLIIDLTDNNNGAYYEAGYAQALGIEVIACCEKSKIKNVHFDVSQKNMIVWDAENEEELISKLRRRIEATVGRGNESFIG